MANKKENPVKNTLILVVISVIAIILLAIVNQITMGPIQEAELKTRADAYKSIFTCDDITEIDGIDDKLANSADMLAEKGFNGCEILDSMKCLDANGNTLGYVIAASSNAGYGGEIVVAIGIQDGKITGYRAISNSETAGLGSKCTEDKFSNQFKGKAASLLSYTKTGATSDTEIDAISGATITTNAVTQAVNAGIIFYQEELAGIDSQATERE